MIDMCTKYTTQQKGKNKNTMHKEYFIKKKRKRN